MVAQVGVKPVNHTLGNHCLSVPRAELKARLHITGGDYRTVEAAPGWLLIILDTTEVTNWLRTLTFAWLSRAGSLRPAATEVLSLLTRV